MTKIIQITDTHIVPSGELAYQTVDTAAALAEAVETVNRLLPQIGPVGLVIVTGDLTEHGSVEEYRRFQSIMSALDVPYQAVPGNHDGREEMRDCFRETGWMPARGSLNWQVDLEDFAVIGLDSLVDDKAHGSLAGDSIDFLTEQLAILEGKPALVGFHHPPFAVGIDAMDKQNMVEPAPFAAALARYPGEIHLVCGHLHRSIAGVFSGRLCQVCPGTSHAVTLDQRANAGNSLTVEPGGIMLHEWRDNRFLSHLIPVGRFEGPFPFLGVD
jgi:Icc protein